ncbi:hypothetical protein ABH935_004486 [Catenulispora sp. GAS73]|uniref:papain-like cysteine protease family protein n=1 Tax=Catenulispora sp. GAS73 TaxID=3156269 RepID=UPI003511AEAA
MSPTLHAKRPGRLRTAVIATAVALLTAVAVPASAATANQLNLTMQSQQYSNWCWAASGNTVAAFYGYNYSQNQFCDMAFGNSLNAPCSNSQASLADDQNAFQQIGISPGNYVTGYLYYSSIIREIDAGRPVMARIQWSSGGGHMEVLYGYDQSRGWVYWGDPWPSDNRYNWGSYNYYVSNGSFSWTHSLDYIGA